MTADTATGSGLDDAGRSRLALLADRLISGGAGMPPASEVDVQGKWIDRALVARPDLAPAVTHVVGLPGEPQETLDRLKQDDRATFDAFAYVIAGSYLMVPRVRKALGLPGTAPQRKPAYPDEADFYLEDGILQPVIDRGPIYRPTPDAG